MKKVTAEVPLVFPSLEPCPRRYVVNEINRTLRSVDYDPSLSNSTPPVEQFVDDDVSRMRGMTSVSSIANGSVVTSPLPENSYVLVVTLLANDGSAPIMIQLDLGSEASCFSNPVKVQAVPCGQTNTIDLITVMEDATILRIKLNAKTLGPVHEEVLLWKAGEEFIGKLEAVTRAHLNSSMIVVLSHSRLLLALNPFLLAVDLENRETFQWSKLKCEERMRERASVLFRYTSVFRASASAINETFFDMQPVSALCVADNDPCHVFSFHIDGKLRHWTLEDPNDSSQPLFPWAVDEPSVKRVPRGELWDGNDPFAISMTAKLYQEKYALAIHIRTRLADTEAAVGADDESEMFESNESVVSRGYSNLFVVEGFANMGSDKKGHEMRLQTPVDASSIVDMAFRDHGRLSLSVLFQNSKSDCSTHAEYEKVGNSMVKSNPYDQSSAYFLEDVAIREKKRIEKLTFMDDFSFSMNSDVPLSLEDRIQHIDQRFLTYLFRPACPRGTGTILPPRPIYIRRSLNKLNRVHQTLRPNHISIELETLQAVQDWRRRDASRMQPKTPVKRSQMIGSNGNVSMYDSVVKPSRREMEQDLLDIVEVEQVQVAGDWRRVCQDHESRWRSLLTEIWEQERRDRSPLCFAAINAHTADDAVVVRAGSISILRREEVAESTEPLDEVSWNIIDTFSGSTEYSALGEFERLVHEYVRQGKLGIDSYCVDNLQVVLSELCDKLSPVLEKSLESLTASQLSGSQNIHHLPIMRLLSTESSLNSLRGDCKGALSTQQRLAAAGLMVRSVEILRRLFLGRLIVLQAKTHSTVPAALRAYLKSVTCLYISAQRVDMRYILSEKLSLQPMELRSQTGTRESFPGASSVLAICGVRDKTISIDSLLIYLSDAVTVPSRPSYTSSVAQLASDAIYRFLCNARGDGSPFSDVKLPDLASIPPSTGSLTDEPKLALRLLAINMSLPDRCDRIMENERKHVFAMCLLTASRTANDLVADSMVASAMTLLPFDISDIPSSMQNTQTLCHHLAGRERHASALQNYIVEAIHRTLVDGAEGVEKLWLSLFTISVAVRDWQTALNASLSCSNAKSRRERLERLIRAMVDAGALAKLCDMSLVLESTIEEKGLIDALGKRNELYSVAVETLQENSCRDNYSYLAVEPEPLSDYLGALYALHVSQRKWKNAALSLHVRYKRAQAALSKNTESSGLSLQALDRREMLIIEDIVLASSGCIFALRQVSGSQGDFLAPNMAANSPTGICGEDIAFFTKDEIANRAVWTIALKKLFWDTTSIGKAFAASSFSQTSISHYKFKTCIDLLFACGYYHDGLIVAYQQKKLLESNPGGRDIFADALGHLLCTYLIPLASGDLVPTTRPTLSQIRSAYETTGLTTRRPPILALRLGANFSGLYSGAVKSGANALCHSLTTLFTTSDTPIAKEVAEGFLSSERGAAQLPAWLEHFLAHGNGDTERPGLFAKRPSEGDTTLYLGDPNALLSLYMKRGLFAESCKLVSTVLSGFGCWHRKAKSSSRLPEKGDVDYVPYNKIDLLWNIIEAAVQSNTIKNTTELLAARNEMERALEKHFELIKISEIGLPSARTLASPSN